MSKEAFEQQLREAGCTEQQISNSLASFDQNQAKQPRWKEQFDHWANVDAFNANMQGISADRVIDNEESTRICFLLSQWESQLSSARDYVVNYRRVEPSTVENNPGLGNLQTEAERGLELLAEIECE